uniref:Uncharacterized protein n=1 Tax=Entomoneis paludosa TaxID=265537 RepID=A0A7S2YR79_9STRA
MATTAKPLIVAGSLLAVAGLGYLTMRGTGSSSTSTAIVVTDLDDDETGDCITAEEVSQVFDRLFRELQGIFAQLMQNIQMIRMQGQNIPEAQVMALVKNEMINALMAKQKQALEEFDMDYDCLEEATWEFLGQPDKYPQVKKSVDRFQKFWGNVSGQDDLEGWRPGQAPAAPVEILTAEKTMEIAQVYFDSLTEAMRQLVAQYKADGKNLQSPAVQNQLNMDFGEHAQAAGEAALEAVGVSMKQFEASVKAHSDNPTVNRTIQQIQMKQQQELMSIGSSNA